MINQNLHNLDMIFATHTVQLPYQPLFLIHIGLQRHATTFTLETKWSTIHSDTSKWKIVGSTSNGGYENSFGELCKPNMENKQLESINSSHNAGFSSQHASTVQPSSLLKFISRYEQHLSNPFLHPMRRCQTTQSYSHSNPNQSNWVLPNLYQYLKLYRPWIFHNIFLWF